MHITELSLDQLCYASVSLTFSLEESSGMLLINNRVITVFYGKRKPEGFKIESYAATCRADVARRLLFTRRIQNGAFQTFVYGSLCKSVYKNQPQTSEAMVLVQRYGLIKFLNIG